MKNKFCLWNLVFKIEKIRKWILCYKKYGNYDFITIVIFFNDNESEKVRKF